MKKFTAPKAIAPVSGTVLSVDQLTFEGKEFIALKLQLRDRSTKSFNVSASFANSFGISSTLFVGNIVVVEAEECLAGITGFVKDNEEQPHLFDHLAVTAVTPLIEQFMVEDNYADRVIDTVMASRKRIEDAAKESPALLRAPIERSNEDRIARLLNQHDAVTNPDTKANLMLRLVELGYKPVVAKATK